MRSSPSRECPSKRKSLWAGGDVEEVDIADGAVILPGNQLGVIDGTQMYLLAGQTTQEDSKDHFIALAEAVTSN